ncbi:helix-turn-helix domain-containing protein [Leucobacter iarius]|uniref:helix-turn-helix domain-containing protein n=1 Tax=Leucobacter iarius TaxID=333963 RepID=UPI003CD0715D
MANRDSQRTWNDYRDYRAMCYVSGMSMTNPNVAGQSADEIIGERVHQLMWRAKVSQTAFAPVLGLTQSGLSPKLRGKRGWSADELRAVASYFGVSIDYLFGIDNVVGPAGIEPTTSTV